MSFISELVASAFDIVEGVDASLVESITYKYATGPEVYDTATGTNTTPTSSLAFICVRTTLNNEEAVNLDGNPDLELKSSDRVYLISAEKIGRVPSLSDSIASGGKNFRVVGWKSIPGDSVYKVVCRRP